MVNGNTIVCTIFAKIQLQSSNITKIKSNVISDITQNNFYFFLKKMKNEVGLNCFRDKYF